LDATAHAESAHLTGESRLQVVPEGHALGCAAHVPSMQLKGRWRGQLSDGGFEREEGPGGFGPAHLVTLTAHVKSSQRTGASYGQTEGVGHCDEFTAQEPSGHG